MVSRNIPPRVHTATPTCPPNQSSGLLLALASTGRVEDVEVDQLVVITHPNALQDRRNTAFFGALRYAELRLNHLTIRV
jgi:hypothetical protein